MNVPVQYDPAYPGDLGGGHPPFQRTDGYGEMSGRGDIQPTHPGPLGQALVQRMPGTPRMDGNQYKEDHPVKNGVAYVGGGRGQHPSPPGVYWFPSEDVYIQALKNEHVRWGMANRVALDETYTWWLDQRLERVRTLKLSHIVNDQVAERYLSHDEWFSQVKANWVIHVALTELCREVREVGMEQMDIGNIHHQLLPPGIHRESSWLIPDQVKFQRTPEEMVAQYGRVGLKRTWNRFERDIPAWDEWSVPDLISARIIRKVEPRKNRFID